MNDISIDALTPDLMSYDRILVCFSGGKDSLACLLHLLELGVNPDRIELHHHDVDGGARHFMDWPITPAYCRALADHFGLRLLFSRKVGGFEREMLKENARTAPMEWQRLDGTWRLSGGTRGKVRTRRKFPQQSSNLSVRWCSAYLKIDVLTCMMNNEPRFLKGRTLVITGERAEESAARANYKTFEPHRSDNRGGKFVHRYVDHWRPIHAWDETKVWAIIQRNRIIPHPAYILGWSRLSCRQCIFGSVNQWATIRAIYPEAFTLIRAYEADFGITINRVWSVEQMADRGTPYRSALAQPALAALANGDVWYGPVTTYQWFMPAGAFGECAGPT